MRPRDWFEIGVRLLGVWSLINGIDEAVTYANVLMKLYNPSLTSPQGFLTHALAHLLVGLFLFLSARGVVNAVYPGADVIVQGPPGAA